MARLATAVAVFVALLCVVDLAADRALPKPVTLSAAKADAVLKGTELARLPRLSVMPFTEAQFQRLLRMADA